MGWRQYTKTFKYTLRRACPMLLLILTLFSEPTPKLQQCNQVLITRLWCLQAVWKRCMCVRECVRVYSVYSIPRQHSWGFGEGGGVLIIQTVSFCTHTRTHTHTHTHQMLTWCVCDVANGSSVVAVWGHMLSLITTEQSGLALINSTDMTIKNPPH